MKSEVPQGVEVLVKKASVDRAFKAILLDRRAAAADEIGLRLEPAEATMLAAVSRDQLEAVIARAHVPQAHRRTFLGRAAATMLAALNVVAGKAVLSAGEGGTFGNRPGESKKDDPQKEEAEKKKEKEIENRITEILAQHFNVTIKELKRGESLADDLHASASQLINLRVRFEKEFKLVIPRREFMRVRTVDDMVGFVKETIRRRDAENAKRKVCPSRGSRPDRAIPLTGGMMSDRPTSPPPGNAAPK
jgi:acyl carrier protein